MTLFQWLRCFWRRQDPRARPFTVTLQNTMFAYEWEPKEFAVRACCEDRAIRLAREAVNDCCQVVSVVEAAE